MFNIKRGAEECDATNALFIESCREQNQPAVVLVKLPVRAAKPDTRPPIKAVTRIIITFPLKESLKEKVGTFKFQREK